MSDAGEVPVRSNRWQRMEALFLEALELAPEQRQAFLNQACTDDPSLRKEVEGLLANDSENGDTLGVIVEDAASSAVSDDLIGRHLGVYLVMREIGRGGMGSVYLASRDDRQFRKKVAIKVIRRGLDTEDVLKRFRHERQILANLDHPNIARLLDGGVTPDGRPYLVMEYVEGEPIHAFCGEHDLSLKQKLELFCQVCDAVAYAHRNLVVHRDLKPGNIVVTSGGSVKLLDFGIAKLLRGHEQESAVTQTVTRATRRMLTPDYASPEQLQGLPVNTGTDVYSLGAVLYELLTGKRPHALREFTPEELERQICQVEPVRPSVVVEDFALADALSGDLDNIMLMALRKEPARRYPSVDHFASDVKRYLGGLPVQAREDTLGYRAGKFVRRHRYAVAAASTAIFCLISGASIALWEASVARQERTLADAARVVADRERGRAQQEASAARLARRDVERANEESLSARDEAVREGKRAKDRLHQMIGLVNKAVFDMHTELSALPGATQVRRNLASTALQYLDEVSKEAGNDTFVVGSLAAAYYKLGDVQGRPNMPSLGDFDGAMRSYRKAEELNSGMLRKNCCDGSLLLESVTIQLRIATLLRELGHTSAAVETIRNAYSTLRRIPEPDASSTKVLDLFTDVHYGLSMLYANSQEALSLHHAQISLAYSARLLAARPDEENYLRSYGTSYSRIGSAQLHIRSLPAALANFRKSLELRLQILERHPQDILLMRDVMISYGKVGDLLGGPFMSDNLGDDAGSLENYKQAVEYAERMVKIDPSNRMAESDLAAALMRAGMIELSPRQRRESLGLLERAHAILESQHERQPNSRRYAYDLSVVLEFLGHRMRDLGNTEAAMSNYERSVSISRKLTASDPSNFSSRSQTLTALEAISLLAASMGNRSKALATANEAVALGQGSNDLKNASLDSHLPTALGALGATYEILAKQGTSESVSDWLNACEAFRRSLDAWTVASSETQSVLPARAAKTGQQYAACRERLAQATRQPVR